MGEKLLDPVDDKIFIVVRCVDKEHDVKIRFVVDKEYSEISLSPQCAIQLINGIKQAYDDAGINLEEIEA